MSLKGKSTKSRSAIRGCGTTSSAVFMILLPYISMSRSSDRGPYRSPPRTLPNEFYLKVTGRQERNASLPLFLEVDVKGQEVPFLSEFRIQRCKMKVDLLHT